MLKARFRHDCEFCVLIGNLPSEDVYYCLNEGCVLARRSSNGADYSSMSLSLARVLVPQDQNWEIRVRLADAFLAGRTLVTTPDGRRILT